ncbi:MAG: SDR family NAD(P)-dependent oxidoreductase [Lachnospiraceae bacterium]|nr:SDR family NAD(P)-dependent oxidoreductase [Lachnospiraceae bacterium]
MNTVMVTGADRGVGASLCQIFLEQGWNVIAGQYMPEWDQLSSLQKAYPKQLSIVPLDVGNTESVKAAASEAARVTETVDMLVSCAGVFFGTDNRESMSKVFQINTLGTLRLVEAFEPLMKDGQKKIAVLSSEAGSISLAHRTDSFGYCMSKAALNMTVKLLYNQLKPKGYQFYLYHPGWVRSYMTGKKSTEGDYEPEESALVAYRQFTGASEEALIMKDVQDCYWSF